MTNPWQNRKSVELKRGSENSWGVFRHPFPSCKRMGLKVRFCSENKALGVVFPDSGSGSECLDDNPHNFTEMPSVFHKKLPGQIVNATLQCRLQFGQGYFHCPQRKVSKNWKMMFFSEWHRRTWKITPSAFNKSQTCDLLVSKNSFDRETFVHAGSCKIKNNERFHFVISFWVQ